MCTQNVGLGEKKTHFSLGIFQIQLFGEEMLGKVFKGLSFKPMGFLVKDNIGMWMLKTFLSKKVIPFSLGIF